MGHVDTALFLIRLSRQEPTPSPILGTSHSPTSGAQSGSTRGLTELHELVLHSEDPLPPAFTVRKLLRTTISQFSTLEVKSDMALATLTDVCVFSQQIANDFFNFRLKMQRKKARTVIACCRCIAPPATPMTLVSSS